MSAPNSCLFSITRFFYSRLKIFTNKKFSQNMFYMFYLYNFSVKRIVKNFYFPPDGPLNNYFSKVASNLDRNIPHSNISPLNFLGAPVENSFFRNPLIGKKLLIKFVGRRTNPPTS